MRHSVEGFASNNVALVLDLFETKPTLVFVGRMVRALAVCENFGPEGKRCVRKILF